MNEQGTSSGVADFDPRDPLNSVSVVIPVYNGAKFIAETLKSVLAQTLSPSEVIVVNDGSVDNTVSIVQGFARDVSLLTTGNQGAPAARNRGARMARSKWLAFCDADDLWLPAKLEKQLRLAHECPEIHVVLTDYADFTYDAVADRSHHSWAPENFWVKDQRRNGFVVREAITGKLTIFQPSITSTPLVKREFYWDVGGFDESQRRNSAEDTCFHFRCLSMPPFGVVPEVLMHYRRHPESWSSDNAKQLSNSVLIWEYIIATYPQAHPHRTQLLAGLAAMRTEAKATARYQRRQKIKRWLGFK